MIDLTKLQAEFETAKPGYGFAKSDSGMYVYQGTQDMFEDWLENNELRKAKLRITELEGQLTKAQKDSARLDFAAMHCLLCLDSVSKRPEGNGQLLVAADRENIDAAIQPKEAT